MGAYEFHFDGNLKAVLQGPYDTNAHLMATLLSSNVPPTSPYVADARTVGNIPSNVTDWIMLQVRPGITNNPVYARSLFLRNDGRILSDQGDTNLLIEVSPLTTNYLVVSHRNHLSAMSAQPIIFTNQQISFDFTSSSDQYYAGTNGAVELEPGAWGMIAGDADGDGKITAVDKAMCEGQEGQTGYLAGDFNLDGFVSTNEP